MGCELLGFGACAQLPAAVATSFPAPRLLLTPARGAGGGCQGDRGHLVGSRGGIGAGDAPAMSPAGQGGGSRSQIAEWDAQRGQTKAKGFVPSTPFLCWGGAWPQLTGSRGLVPSEWPRRARNCSVLHECWAGKEKKKKKPTLSPRTDGSSAGDFAEISFLLIWQYAISNADNHLCACEVSASRPAQK